MTRSVVSSLGSLGLLGLLGSAACGSDPPPPTINPRVLWLAPLGRDETHVSLVDTEPPPF